MIPHHLTDVKRRIFLIFFSSESSYFKIKAGKREVHSKINQQRRPVLQNKNSQFSQRTFYILLLFAFASLRIYIHVLPKNDKIISKSCMLFRLTLFKVTHAILPNVFVSFNYELINVFAIYEIREYYILQQCLDTVLNTECNI